MITPQQIRGVLLEEAVLHLLRKSGYKTVDAPGGDPTLHTGGAGLFVRGRGGSHQIDAIADFLIHQPFTNPSRLLVEAKCYFRRDVRLPEVRNAVGVLKDVSEFWVPGPGPVAGRRRYHYQSAIVSASGFSEDAQEYAFAHDIYLIPLGDSPFFRPLLEAIRTAVRPFPMLPDSLVSTQRISYLRRSVREALRYRAEPEQETDDPLLPWVDLRPFLRACEQLNYVLVGVLGGQFPILLAPGEEMRLGDIPERLHVRIYWNESGWYLGHDRNHPLFSFDLPRRLFDLYAEEGNLSAERALQLKAEFMGIFQAIQTDNGRARIITFELDFDWLNQLRRRDSL